MVAPVTVRTLGIGPFLKRGAEDKSRMADATNLRYEYVVRIYQDGLRTECTLQSIGSSLADLVSAPEEEQADTATRFIDVSSWK